MSDTQPNQTLERVDCVVIGAGVIGLAVARQLAVAGRDVILLESTDCIGSGTSSRNSEVIHAGIYYPKGSLKARMCVQGRDLLYAYCADRGVPHKRCGKLLVATDESQLPKLDEIVAKARANGVMDLTRISAAEVARSGAGTDHGRSPRLPVQRHRRYPRPDAGLPGRDGRPWRHGRVQQPCHRRQGHGRRDHHRDRRAGAVPAARQSGGQCRPVFTPRTSRG